MKKIFAILMVFLISPNLASAAVMPLEQVKNILDITKTSWVAYRDFNGNQLIYFTHLEGWKCGIAEVKYGLNGADLDKLWMLETCNPNNPNAITKDNIWLTFPLGSIQNIDVQLTFDDGTKSEIVNFKP